MLVQHILLQLVFLDISSAFRQLSITDESRTDSLRHLLPEDIFLVGAAHQIDVCLVGEYIRTSSATGMVEGLIPNLEMPQVTGHFSRRAPELCVNG